jgi:selenide,water dikinase
LDAVLSKLPKQQDKNVLVGFDKADDAGVYRLGPSLALVQTVDFFTPIVDDPYTFGQIAATNALSDVYAKGGRPLLALNIAGFPRKLSLDILAEILRGGAEKALEAGVLIVGGHTIDDPEPKYGLAVTGLVHPARFVSNAGARPGDVLFLTKPIGIGVITTGIKQDKTPPSVAAEAVRIMSQLNRAASEAMIQVGVHAATDVTGFGLLGHLYEMVDASGVAARISAAAVPVLPGAADLARQGAVAGGTARNLEWLADKVRWAPTIDETTRILLADAQTSGGLLIAVASERAAALEEAMHARRVEPIARIGEIVTRNGFPIDVHP